MSRCSIAATITPFSRFLYQVALAVLSPANIAQSIRTIMRNKPNVEVLMDEVIGFDVAERRLSMKSNATSSTTISSGDRLHSLLLRQG